MSSVLGMDGPDIVRRPPFGDNPLVGERGSDTQRRILGAALEVFAEVGFNDARVELITKRAGCSRPAFYQYFSSKDDVFWRLAGELGHEMVELGDLLAPVSPDADGVAALARWIDEFTTLYETYAPVFSAFQAASRDHTPLVEGSSSISERMGDAMLGAFGLDRRTKRNTTLATSVVAVLIRCSFYWASMTGTVQRPRLIQGLAQIVHRLFAGPIEGVNILPTAPHHAVAAGVSAPPVPTNGDGDGRALRPRGEKTRRLLLDAGAAVLPARGFHDARVDDIVELAGVSHGSFYRYFENKDDFFRVLAEEASGELIDLLGRLPLADDPDGLQAWIEEWFSTYESNGGVISTWQEMQTAGDDLISFSQQVAAVVVADLMSTLDARGFGDPLVDALALVALFERIPYSVHTLRFAKQTRRHRRHGHDHPARVRRPAGLVDFEFTDDQLELRDNARQVLSAACPATSVRAVFDGSLPDPSLWSTLVDLDWPALGIDEQHGGMGLGFLEVGIVVEELGRVVAPTPFLATITQMVPFLRAGRRDDALTEVAAGQLTGTLAIAEDAGWWPEAIATTARPVSDGWVLDGVKRHVVDGATAPELVVVARSPGTSGADGLGAFLVPAASVSVEPTAVIDPTLPIATVTLPEVRVELSRVLIEPGDPAAATTIDRCLEEATVAMALSTVATSRAIFETTLQYAKDREQFGRPIGSFQALKHRLADVYLAVERASALAYFAALTIAEDDPRRATATSMAKAAAGECQRLAVRDGLQLHGGVGFTWEHDLHLLLKRAKTGDLLFGTSAAHRVRLAHLLDLDPPMLTPLPPGEVG